MKIDLTEARVQVSQFFTFTVYTIYKNKFLLKPAKAFLIASRAKRENIAVVLHRATR
jgi:hypothetical protein